MMKNNEILFLIFIYNFKNNFLVLKLNFINMQLNIFFITKNKIKF